MCSPLEHLVRLLHRTRPPRHVPVCHTEPLNPAAAEILAHIAHELRQPVSALLAAFRVICSPQHSGHEHATAVVDRQLHLLSRLIDDLMEATRLHVHRPSLHVSRIDIRCVTQDAVDALVPQASVKRQRLSLSLPEDPVFVAADWVRIQQVISNLVANAIKYTGTDGIVQVRLHECTTQAVLTVADTGQGIQRELLSRVFDEFVQGDPTRDGLGLGLAVARQLVSLHGGALWAESAGSGSGSVFVVTLPISPADDCHLLPPPSRQVH